MTPISRPRWSSSSANFPTTTPAPPGLSQPARPSGFRSSGMRRRQGGRMAECPSPSNAPPAASRPRPRARHNHAWFEAAFDRMVLGRLSHGHPFESRFRRCNCKSNSGSVPTSPRGCCAPSCAAPWSRRAARRSLDLVEVDRDRDPVADQDRIRFAADGGRSPQAQNVGRRRRRSRKRRARTPRLAAIQGLLRRLAVMASSPPTSPRARRSKPTAGRPTPAPPTSGTSPMSSAPWPPMSYLPWVHRAFSNAKTWRSASITDCEDSISKATSTNSPSASTDAEPDTQRFAHFSQSPSSESR